MKSDSKIVEAKEFIEKNITCRPGIGIILGSGLGCLVDEFENMTAIEFGDIPNFPVSTVEGHRGDIVTGKLSGVNVMALAGRIHYYEGYSMREVCFPVRVMSALGINKLIVTNAAGGINRSLTVGEIVIINDHINLMGNNPLIGSPEFADMTNAYDNKLKKMAYATARMLNMKIREGVYLAMSGPSYETPAEINMARTLGADMVGMSTVPEVIVANSLGVKVLGLSMVTNMAAGITGEPLSHEEVIETTQKAQEKFKKFIKKIIENMKNHEV